MATILDKVGELKKEVKDRFERCMERLFEEAGTASTGRVRLREMRDAEVLARNSLERQVASLRKEFSKKIANCAEETATLHQKVEVVEKARADLQIHVQRLENEIKALRNFVGMSSGYLPSRTSETKYKNLSIAVGNGDASKK